MKLELSKESLRVLGAGEVDLAGGTTTTLASLYLTCMVCDTQHNCATQACGGGSARCQAM